MLSLFHCTVNALVESVKTGKTFSTKLKIFTIFVLSVLQGRGPSKMKRYFDLAVRGFLFETDVKFCIGSIHDFFVFSPSWEAELRSMFLLQNGMRFVDVGAHIGKYTIRAAKMIGSRGTVVAVEPNKENFSFLVKNIRLNRLKNCIPLNVAAGQMDTETLLFFGVNSAEHSIKQNLGKGFCKVQVKTLDNILAENGIGDIDLVKVDVEGAEYEVVKGMEKTLKNQKPIVIIEVLAKDKDKVVNYMKSMGYEENILNTYPSFRGGLNHYCFKPVKLDTKSLPSLNQIQDKT